MSLQSLIERNNLWAQLSGRPEMDINSLTQADANNLFRSIECELSPENLTCDGELSRSQVQARADELYHAVDDLRDMGFTVPADCYF